METSGQDEKKHALATRDSRGEEDLPAYHEQLGFLPAWKRGVLGLGTLMGLAGSLQLGLMAREAWLLGGTPSGVVLLYGLGAAVTLLAGITAATMAWRGTVQVRRPSRFDRVVAIAAPVAVAIMAFGASVWIGGLAMLACVWAALEDLDRLGASFAAEEPAPPPSPALPAGEPPPETG